MNEETVPVDPDSGRRQDRRWLLLAGGAAVAVLVLLVIAVVHTAREATHPQQVTVPVPSSTSTSATVRITPAPTSYLPPSPQISQATTSVAPVVPDAPGSAEPSWEAPAPSTTATTIFNPYVTTSPPNAGAF